MITTIQGIGIIELLGWAITVIGFELMLSNPLHVEFGIYKDELTVDRNKDQINDIINHRRGTKWAIFGFILQGVVTIIKLFI